MKDNINRMGRLLPVSSDISDLCETSDLFLHVSYSAQSNGINFID